MKDCGKPLPKKDVKLLMNNLEDLITHAFSNVSYTYRKGLALHITF